MTRIIATKLLNKGRVIRIETDVGTFRFLADKLHDMFNCKECKGGTTGVSHTH